MLNLLIEQPLYSEVYRFAGIPDRVWGDVTLSEKQIDFEPEGHIFNLNGVRYPSITQVLTGSSIIDFSMVEEKRLERASAFGTAVHQATHYDDLDDLDEETLDPNLIPYLDAWRTFRKDFYSKGPCIVEIKSGVKVYDFTGLQLAAQGILAGLPTALRVAVQLKPNGKYHPEYYEERTDRGTFLSALNIYNWKGNHK